MNDDSTISIAEIAAGQTFELRRRVLRNGDPSATVEMAADSEPSTWHMGATAAERVVGTSSFYAVACPLAPELQPAYQLRFMAVDGDFQRRGIGARLLEAAFERLRREEVALLWANARNSALSFYLGLGFETVGDTFIETVTQLPHTVVMRRP